MKQTTVADVMTRKVVAVRDGAEFKEIVDALRNAHVSALPVLDSENHVIGVVSEGDLLVKEAAVAGQRKATRRHAGGADKATEVLAIGLMTQPAVTIGRDATVAEAARVMSSGRVRRLPVVDDWGRLIGIVSQLDPARRNVVEFRHASWWNEDVYNALRKAGIIFCSCSGPSFPMTSSRPRPRCMSAYTALNAGSSRLLGR